MHRFFALALLLAITGLPMVSGCSKANAKPNCDRMRACCAALRSQEEGLPKEHEILCHHNPELDEGCVDTIADITKFTPSKNLPGACR
jgi:hypothetical protein